MTVLHPVTQAIMARGCHSHVFVSKENVEVYDLSAAHTHQTHTVGCWVGIATAQHASHALTTRLVCNAQADHGCLTQQGESNTHRVHCEGGLSLRFDFAHL